MRIVNQPKIMLTAKEAEAFNDTIRLLKSITTSPEVLNADLTDWASEAWTILARRYHRCRVIKVLEGFS